MGRIMEDVSKWTLEKRERFMKKVFEEKMGRPLSFEEPKSFSEMIQWVKLYYHDPEMGRCVDKVLFKEFVREKFPVRDTGGGIRLKYMKFGNRQTR